MEGFQDLLFELSSDERYSILLLLHEKPSTITEISKSRGLTTQEVSRHTSRLSNTSLIRKETNGTFSITPYGQAVMKLVVEFQFLAKHREYFTEHTVTQLPLEFVERLGELNASSYKNTIDFLHNVNNMIKEAKEFVWLQVDQYPVTAIEPIREALGRKIRFKVIEPKGTFRQELELETPEEAQALAGTRRLPLGQQRTVDKIDVFIAITDSRCAFAFPNRNGEFDYTGFISNGDGPRTWCRELFEKTWSTSL